ncbi:DUF6197 family protein [Agrobacterium rosae]|uniref:DUF6197 family protein n=1 Tax=Agrobacterium rosae TaxID=1972867 RepID=UPI002A1531AF|nr:hypothetical protein [Agrobacterium rosae]MDX8315614.1 hypothetical protein [Agrobacterium rosae]
MDTVQILKDARALIADENNWTQECYARDVQGEMTLPNNADAVCFCAIGSIQKVGEFPVSRRLPLDITELFVGADFEERESSYEVETFVTAFNDTHKHAEVLALFDRAIARAESEAVQ